MPANGSAGIGEIHPTVAAEWDLDSCLGFEVSLAGLADSSPLGNETYSDFAPFPPVDRDLAIVIDDLPTSRILEADQGGGWDLLANVSIFDLYRGAGISEDEKSIALRLRFRAVGPDSE